MSEKRETWSLLVKPTNECNINCQYCYDKPLREKYHGAKMSIEIVDHIAKLASEYAKKVKWIWHGGEPTLMGPDWYREVQDVFFKYYMTGWEQQMQSNGVLLDDDWIKLSKDFDIQIGISFDAFSQYVRAGSDDSKVWNVINKFNDEGALVGTISVINQENYTRQIELYEFFKKNLKGYIPAFNHIYRSGGTLKYNLEITVDDYIKEFEKYYRYWLYDTDEDAINERSVTNITNNLIGSRALTCSEADCRLEWIGVNSTGDIYPCDRYVGEKYYMGNIMDYNSINEIYDSEGFKTYFREVQKRLDTTCMDCGYHMYCQGGCNANHIAVSGNAEGCDDFSCELFRRKLKMTYNILREVDVYADKLNQKFILLALEHPFVSVKEIKEFLNEMGYREPVYEDDGKKLLECEEFKLFRIFNTFKGAESNGHVDYTEYVLERNAVIDKNFDMNSLRENRRKLMESVYTDKKEKIDAILGNL